MLPILIAIVLPPPAGTAVTDVVVYTDRAIVTRRVTIPCTSGTVARFPHIPPAADPRTFRTETKGGSVEAIRSGENARREPYSPRVAELDERLRKLDAEVAAGEAQLARIQSGGESGEAFRQIAERLVRREAAESRPDTAAWKDALDTVLDTGLAAARNRTPVDARLRVLNRDRAAARAERDALAAATDRREYQAEVELSCRGPVELAFSYLVGGASWSPAYEARTDEDKRTLELATFATVRQTTGEDWRGARIVLSTAQPRTSATPPRVQPLAVFAEERAPLPKQIVARAETIRHAETASATATTGTGTALRARAQGLSVQVALPEPADVPGDGTPVRLLVARNRLGAELRLRATPRLAPYVFRIAEAFNGAPFALLAGPVDVYRGAGFVARQTLTEVPRGGRFSVSLGVEERVRVARLILEESERPAGLLGRRRDLRFRYRFELSSALANPEEVELADQLPVSELDDVTVTMEGTTAGYALDPDGIVRWRHRLRPGESQTTNLGFRVAVPSRYR